MFDATVPEQAQCCEIRFQQEQSQLARITAVFNREFSEIEGAELLAGAKEPYYQPALAPQYRHRLFSREDSPASALHEVAHWCLAGPARRLLPDFGYWYAADGRNQQQQSEFQQVEVKPQAIEWAFSRAVGLRFQVSIDNLNGEAVDPFGFQLAVWQQARNYALYGLPPQAEQFAAALRREFQGAESAPEPASLAALYTPTSGS